MTTSAQRTVIVTGASPGIGAGLVSALRKRGGNVGKVRQLHPLLAAAG